MPFARPSLTALRNQSVEDITTSGVPGLTGLLRKAVLRVLAWCMAGLAYSVYGYADWIARMGVPFTAEDEYLHAWAALIGIYPEASRAGHGTATFTGTVLRAIPKDTALTRQRDGMPFATTADGRVDETGAITVPIVAEINGAATNGEAGDAISIRGTISGINSTGVTGLITGGADDEDNPTLRNRTLFKYREPPQGGAGADYIQWALEVPGVTRAWINGGGAGAGTVVVYPMLDTVNAAYGGFPQGVDGVAIDEKRGYPAAGDQLAVANRIWQSQPITARVHVVAPHPFPIDVSIPVLVPNTLEIQDEIAATLKDMLLAVSEVAGTIWPSQLYEAILAVPGINYFELADPLVGVRAPMGYLPVVGDVTCPLLTNMPEVDPV